jgi:hypothetical protein
MAATPKMKLVNRFCSFLDALAAVMEAKSGFCVILAAWVFFVVTGIRAQHRLFWYDELLTVKICALPTFTDVWAAVRAGMDLNPPLQFLAVRASQGLFGSGHLATRLPVIIGFLVMSLCLFLLLRRRMPVSLAIAGMIFPWLTEAYRFALDARPYGILLGCAGAALLCWSRAAEGGRRVVWLAGLSLSLALALLTHCYAVLLALPFLSGEIVRLRERKRADWGMWAALAASALPLAIYPAMLAANAAPPVQRSWFFHVTLGTAPDTYREMLEPAFWPLVLAVLFLVTAGLSSKRASSMTEGFAMRPSELAVVIGYAAIPVSAVMLSAVTTHSFSLRYGSCGVIGVACLLAMAVARQANAARNGAVLALLFLSSFAAGFGQQLWTAIHPAEVHASGPAELQPVRADSVPAHPLLSHASGNQLPVVIASGLQFLEIEHYGGDALLARTYYLTDVEASLRRTGAASFDATYPTMKRLFHLRANVVPVDAFLAQHRQFLLYSSGYVVEWLQPELLARGWQVRLLAKLGAADITEVTRPR